MLVCQHVLEHLFYLVEFLYNAPKVTLTVTDNIFAHYPEKSFFRTLNFCLIVARFYIYVAPKENEPLSFLAFKILLKNKLSTEPSYV